MRIRSLTGSCLLSTMSEWSAVVILDVVCCVVSRWNERRRDGNGEHIYHGANLTYRRLLSIAALSCGCHERYFGSQSHGGYYHEVWKLVYGVLRGSSPFVLGLVTASGVRPLESAAADRR